MNSTKNLDNREAYPQYTLGMQVVVKMGVGGGTFLLQVAGASFENEAWKYKGRDMQSDPFQVTFYAENVINTIAPKI